MTHEELTNALHREQKINAANEVGQALLLDALQKVANKGPSATLRQAMEERAAAINERDELRMQIERSLVQNTDWSHIMNLEAAAVRRNEYIDNLIRDKQVLADQLAVKDKDADQAEMLRVTGDCSGCLDLRLELDTSQLRVSTLECDINEQYSFNRQLSNRQNRIAGIVNEVIV
ncbi:MAG: hypothetical protein ACI88C_000081 [Acidimicrobiales bacterium]|jgi:hypothetical protein